jgi:hypothetical protein
VPVDRTLAEGLATNVADLYRDAETRLAANLARKIRTDITADSENRLQALEQLRKQAETILAGLSGPRQRLIEQALMQAYARGASAAVDEMARLESDRWIDFLARRSRIVRAIAWLVGYSKHRDARLAEAVARLRADLPGIDAMMGLAQELTQRMSSTHFHVLRWQADAYREVMAQPAFDVLVGTKTRLRAAQVVWEHLLSKGVTGFTDRSGRNWDLASYTEMATRTTVAHAALEGALDRFKQAGVGLVIVSNAPQECERCRPFEGKVLAIAGPAGPRQMEHGLHDGVMVTVDVVDTVAGAVAKGLMHPNCRHSLAAYLPGVTRVPTHTQDPQGDKDRQTLRRLERELRALKLREAAVIDAAARKALAQKVRAKQARIREHVKTTTAKRQPQREQIGTAR